jgi:biopolymer transport protein ExbD
MPDAPLRFVAPDDSRGSLLQMAPLVDIVFLLICFYLFVSQTINEQADPRVSLPVMTADVAAPEQPAEIVINVLAPGTSGGGELIVLGQTVNASELDVLLRNEAAKARAAGQSLRVVVRADRRQRFRSLQEVLVTCKRAGLSQVILRAGDEP